MSGYVPLVETSDWTWDAAELRSQYDHISELITPEQMHVAIAMPLDLVPCSNGCRPEHNRSGLGPARLMLVLQ